MVKMWSAVQLLCLTVITSKVQGRPDGAPSDACVTLNPGHVGIDPQFTPLPFDLLVDKTEPTIDEPVTLTIKGKTPEDQIAGFMVQVRERCETPIGTFTPSDNVKTMDCPGGVQNTVTHVSSDLKPEVSITWTPPKGYTGPATFFVTVAKTKDVFWVARTTETIWYSAMVYSPADVAPLQ